MSTILSSEERNARKKIHPFKTKNLIRILKTAFAEVPDKRSCGKVQYSLKNVLMAGWAIFSSKSPSLIQFCEKSKQTRRNLHLLYETKSLPSDTSLREILDPVDPQSLRKSFTSLFELVQKNKALTRFSFLKGHYLLSIDGTNYFSSQDVHCASCCQKVSRKTGDITYYHQMLSGVLVHPDVRYVLPLCPEPVQKADGEKKNDCEQNASKRFITSFRKEHPRLKAICVQDGLYSTGPYIKFLQHNNLSFILGTKKTQNQKLFEFIEGSEKLESLQSLEVEEKEKRHQFRYMNGVPLNESHPDLEVNFLHYTEESLKKGKRKAKKITWSWVTDIPLTNENVMDIMKGGRARWRIENQTFNTLKNQGYHFEHNYGHGYKNLSIIFAFLMMLAFFVDQIQEMSYKVFRESINACRTRRKFWEKIHFFISSTTGFESWEHLFDLIEKDVFPSFNTS